MEKLRKVFMDNPGHRHLPRPSRLPSSLSVAGSSAACCSSPMPQPAVEAAHDQSKSPAPLSNVEAAMVSSVDWSVDSLVRSNKSFNPIRRISALLPPQELAAEIHRQEASGVPLIIEGWHHHPEWNADLFSIEGFIGNGDQVVEARNVHTAEDVKMSLRELVQHYQDISKQAQPNERTRFYGKDVQCPAAWEEWLRCGGLPTDLQPCGPSDMITHLPSEHRPETLMCYLGIGDTLTPAHKDLCGSFGQNLMCHTTDDGSAFWFMSATGPMYKDEPAMYFHDKLGVELDHESHTATVAELNDAPFDVYVAEQRLGDLVLVPPRSCHQVVNRGGVTIKMSWSRMGLMSLELSLYDELPLYHRVCRQETYRVKLTVFHSVKEYMRRLTSTESPASSPSPRPTSNLLDSRLPLSSCRDRSPSAQPMDVTPPPFLQEDVSTLRSLLLLLDEILVEEWHPAHKDLDHVPTPLSGVAELHSCDFCGGDIFQSFFSCSECVDADEGSEFICCSNCYVEGRSCACEAGHMVPRQSLQFEDLMHTRNNAADVLNKHLPQSEQIPRCSARTMDASQHLPIFLAACTLRQKKIDYSKSKARGKQSRRCTTRVDSDPAHDVPAMHALNCDACQSKMCFGHILKLHNVHAAQAVLAQSDRTEWHRLHTTKNRKCKPLSLGEPQERGPPPLRKRLAWLAKIFTKCRPVDAKRGREGFYDDFKLAPAEAEDEADQTPQVVEEIEQLPTDKPSTPDKSAVADSTPIGRPTSTDEPAATDKPVTVAQAIREDSPLTSLPDSESEESMDVDDGATSSDYSPPPRRRVSLPTPAAKSIRAPLASSRRNLAFVLLPSLSKGKKRTIAPDFTVSTAISKGNKRMIAPDSAVSTTPTKRAKTIPMPRTPVSRSPSLPTSLPRESSSQTTMVRRVVSASANATSSSSAIVAQTPSPVARPANVHRKWVGPKVPKPSRPLDPPRVGRPHRSARPRVVSRRIMTSSRESSLDRSKRIAPTPPTQNSAAPIHGTDNYTSLSATAAKLSELLEAERMDKQALQKRVNELQISEIILKVQLEKLKKDSTDYQARVLRERIAKADADLLKSNAQRDEYATRLGEVERQVERLTDDSVEWTRAVRDRDYEIRDLTNQVHQGRAAVQEKERSMSGLANLAGLFGQGIGAVLQNHMVPPNTQVQRWPCPPPSYGYLNPPPFGPQMQGVPVGGTAAEGSAYAYFPGPGHEKAVGPYNGRGRGGNRYNMGGKFHGRTRQGLYQSKGAQEQRHVGFYDQPPGRAARGEYHARAGRPRALSGERRIVYERGDHYEEQSSSPPDQSVYRDREEEINEDAPASARQRSKSGDGGWSNVRGSQSPIYLADDRSTRPPNKEPSPNRTVCSPPGSPSFQRRDIEDYREPYSRQGTPDAPNQLSRDHTDDMPMEEQLDHSGRELRGEKSDQNERSPLLNQHENARSVTEDPSRRSYEGEISNPWVSSPRS